jgi:hypothetical protein
MQTMPVLRKTSLSGHMVHTNKEALVFFNRKGLLIFLAALLAVVGFLGIIKFFILLGAAYGIH